MLAPGSRIDAADITMSGTSQASPHVAGAVAALASKCGKATVDQIEQALTTSGPSITDPRNQVTKRRLDVLAAGQALIAKGLCA
jgi:subtilisin family serine protease